MKYISSSFKEVITSITHTKHTCIEFLQKHNVLARQQKCPGPQIKGARNNYCGNEMALKCVKDRSDGYSWRCRKTHKIVEGDRKYVVKDVKLSIRYNSWIEDSNLSLEIIVQLIYLWSQGFSMSEMEHELKVSSRSLVEWTCYLRHVALDTCIDSSSQIGGPGIEVEIDESKFGKRKYHKGKRVEGKWIFGGRETYDKTKIFMVPVENRKASTLIPIIQRWIAPGSIIHSDCWKAYNKLSQVGYTHVTVNHSKEFVNIYNAACTNRIESEWRHAKAAMPKYGVHKGLHAGYLAQFMWHRTFANYDKFVTLLKHCNESFCRGQIKNVSV